MFCVVRKYTLKAGEKEEVIERAEKHYVDIVSDTPGFVGFFVVNQGDAALTISIFHSEEESKASDHKAARFVREHLAEHVEGPFDVVHGPVVISKVAKAQLAKL
jgi:heme-degrading monooxygenase HmoA